MGKVGDKLLFMIIVAGQIKHSYLLVKNYDNHSVVLTDYKTPIIKIYMSSIVRNIFPHIKIGIY